MTDEEIINTYKLYLNKGENIPLGYLTNHNISLYVDYLLTKIKKCKTNDDILKVYSKKLLIDYGLRHILDIYNDLYDIIQIVYPNRFKKWEIQGSIINKIEYWNSNRIIECFKWIIEEKLQYSTEDIKSKDCRLEIKSQLRKYIKSIRIPTISYLLEKAYPGVYNLWEFGAVPRGYWDNKDNIIRAVKWLAEEKYNIFEDDSRKLTTDIFNRYGLNSIITKYSIYDLLELVYPGEFKPWEASKPPRGYWKDMNHIIEAFKWLIEDRLELKPEEIKDKLSTYDIDKYGLGSLFINVFNHSKNSLIKTLYPDYK